MSQSVDSSKSLPSTVRSAKPKIQPSLCRICEADAKYSYFGVVVCQPCKMFFKRNADLPQDQFVCRYEGNCQIEVNNRHTCNACRLKKCFQCGMTTDRFRASVQTKKKKSVPTSNSDERPLVSFQQIPTLNLLQADQSTLTESQWTLLSNILLSYHENNIVSIGRRLTENRQAENMHAMFVSAVTEELIGAMYETAGEFIRLNADLSHLRNDDRSIVVRSAADRVSSMGGSLGIVQSNLFSCEDFLTAITPIYGPTTVVKTIWASKFFDPDIILMKLGLALFAVSENIVSHPEHPFTALHEPMAIWHIQNRYVEVTWKYLLYRYGYQDAVKQFLSLTCCFIAMTVLTVHLQDVSRHVLDVESIVEQTEMTLILDDVEQIMEKSTP